MSVPAAAFELSTRIRQAQPALWVRPLAQSPQPSPEAGAPVAGMSGVDAARARFARFAPLLARLFPELQESGGAIESPLLRASGMQARLALGASCGQLWIKADHLLPVAGSIKARGGIHEVLEFVESVALREGLIQPGSDLLRLAEPAARERLARYQVAVGSTGNLGLSIGVIASALGLRAVVHMSADAKEWKKARLRSRGVEVIEHAGDYERAVAAGRAQAQADPYGYFVDDERSGSLFMGYAAAALTLRDQLRAAAVTVDAAHPLFVYLPCGVGGAPAGIAYGLHQLFGPHVHCFFAEPVQSPCFLIRMMAGYGQWPGLPSRPSVYDAGLENRTQADGLAVPRASELAYGAVCAQLDGVYTVTDDTLFADLALLHESEGLRVEPSAAAGFSGPRQVCDSVAGQHYLASRGLRDALSQATHLVWTTGGLFVPDEQYQDFLSRGHQSLGIDPAKAT